MNCNEAQRNLNDFLDGELPESTRSGLHEHLGACDVCREHERQLRGLLRRAADLDREIQPPSDLWPGILDGIEATKVVRAGFGGPKEGIVGPAPARLRPTAKQWGLLATAALLLVTLSSAITAVLVGGATDQSSEALVEEPSATAVAWREFEAAETEYLRVTEELLAALEARRDRLAPNTVQIVEENLRRIDEAIAEARAALERDPANAGLTNRLTDIYRKRVTFLQEINRLPL